MKIELFSKTALRQVVLPIEILVGGDVPLIDSVLLVDHLWTNDARFVVDSSQGRVTVFAVAISGTVLFPNSKMTISLDITIDSSSQKRPVIINWTKFSAVQAPIQDSAITPMVSYSHSATYEPILTCCAERRGDMNGDGGNANVSDLTFSVDYIFRGSGDAGDCALESDFNGDGVVLNILDLTACVDYIFRGGVAPAYCF